MSVPARLFLVLALVLSSNAGQDEERRRIRRPPIVIVPGFASSQLHAFRKTTCRGIFGDGLYRDIHEGERVWVDAALFVGNRAFWLKCLALNATTQADPEGSCRARAASPGEGTGAVSELDPGFVTGALSSVMKALVDTLVAQLGYTPQDLVAAPYDWRLPPRQLEVRDDYFFRLKAAIETVVAAKRRAQARWRTRRQRRHAANQEDGGGADADEDPRAVLVAHSMGNNVVRYFVAWLQRELGSDAEGGDGGAGGDGVGAGNAAAHAWCHKARARPVS